METVLLLAASASPCHSLPGFASSSLQCARLQTSICALRPWAREKHFLGPARPRVRSTRVARAGGSTFSMLSDTGSFGVPRRILPTSDWLPPSDDYREILLAQLAYANPLEMPAILEENVESLDDGFYRFLECRIQAAQSGEEQEALLLLRECITDLMSQMISSALKTGSMDENELRSASLFPSKFMSEASIVRCDNLIEHLTKKRSREHRDAFVEAAFEKMDAQFFERLGDRLATCEADEKKVLSTLNQQIERLMSVRLGAASQALQNVLRAGDLVAMERQIRVINDKGGLDDNVLLLLDANIEQARRAGAREVSEVLVQLRDTGLELVSRSEEWEVRVVRMLLRTQNSNARRHMLEEALRAPAQMEGDKLVAFRGKNMVRHLRELLSLYAADTGFRDKVSAIGEESELVACQVFGFDDATKAVIVGLQTEKFHSRAVTAWDLREQGGEERER